MVTPFRTKAAMLPLEAGFMIDAPLTATRSSPPSAACKNTVDVGPPTWIELDKMAAGIFELMPIRTISASRPCFLKRPSSTATIAEAQSLVAVQPIWILVCACAGPAARIAANPATARNLVIDRLSIAISLDRSVFIDISIDHIFHKNTRGGDRETCDISNRRPGEDRPGSWQRHAAVRSGDGRGSRRQRQSGLRIDVATDRCRSFSPGSGPEAVRQQRQGRNLVGRSRRRGNPRADPRAPADARRHVVPAAYPAGAARPAQACRPRKERHGGAGAAERRAARPVARGLSQATDLLHH